MDQNVLTVSQLNNYIKSMIEDDSALKRLTIKGELTNFTDHKRSGHFYFSIKDEKSSIRGIMFKTYASRVPFEPQNGMNVVLTGAVRVFERDGAVQFYCEQMQPDGVGALYLAYEQLKERLDREGLFDQSHKRPLPAFPRTIGVVTSKTGAVLHDIWNVLSRRYPIGRLLLIPTLVQGEGAPSAICHAISLAQQIEDLDVLIVGRGGGTAEDLWAFNHESVARAIYNSRVPVISAVGHEVDFTIADFVADLRAPTPSAAAELVAPDCGQLWQSLQATKRGLDQWASSAVADRALSIARMNERLQQYTPAIAIGQANVALDEQNTRLQQAIKQQLQQKNNEFMKQTALLEALSPMKVLTRGYSITYHADKLLQADSALAIGDQLTTVLPNLTVTSRIESIEQKGE